VKPKAPLYVWIAWGAVILDALAFVAVGAGFRPEGEAALGCMGITGLGFVPLLIAAAVVTVLWRRSLDRRAREELAFKAKVRDIRSRQED